MEYVWLLVAVLTLVVYPVLLLRAAMKGRRWALETLEAMRYLGGEMSASSVWRELPRERRDERDRKVVPLHEAKRRRRRAEAGRLVA